MSSGQHSNLKSSSIQRDRRLSRQGLFVLKKKFAERDPPARGRAPADGTAPVERRQMRDRECGGRAREARGGSWRVPAERRGVSYVAGGADQNDALYDIASARAGAVLVWVNRQREKRLSEGGKGGLGDEGLRDVETKGRREKAKTKKRKRTRVTKDTKKEGNCK